MRIKFLDELSDEGRYYEELKNSHEMVVYFASITAGRDFTDAGAAKAFCRERYAQTLPHGDPFYEDPSLITHAFGSSLRGEETALAVARKENPTPDAYEQVMKMSNRLSGYLTALDTMRRTKGKLPEDNAFGELETLAVLTFLHRRTLYDLLENYPDDTFLMTTGKEVESMDFGYLSEEMYAKRAVVNMAAARGILGDAARKQANPYLIFPSKMRYAIFGERTI